jgi:hypothetical protein
MRASKVAGDCSSPALARDPKLVKIGEGGGIRPTDGWPVGLNTVAL